MKRLWERSEEGRKETYSDAEYRTGTECMGNQAGDNGETVKAKAETGTGEATVRRRREERKGRNRG